MYSCSWWPTRYSPSRIRSAAANAASGSPLASSYAANAWSDSSGSKTAGSGSVRGCTAARAARSVARSGAARRASGSAWWLISPPTGTRIGWSSLIELTMLSPGMSAAVTTTTVDQSNAGSRSSATNRACASVERMVAPNQAPGKTRSSVYFAAPVSLAGPSRRSGPAPRARPGAIVPGWMMTASGDSVRLVRSGKGRPPSRLTLSPAVAPTGASAMFAPDPTGPHRPVTSSTTNWSGDPPDSCRCPGWAACSPSGAQARVTSSTPEPRDDRQHHHPPGDPHHGQRPAHRAGALADPAAPSARTRRDDRSPRGDRRAAGQRRERDGGVGRSRAGGDGRRPWPPMRGPRRPGRIR